MGLRASIVEKGLRLDHRWRPQDSIFAGPLCSAFLGLTKVMQKIGYPERFSQAVRQLHDCIKQRVIDNKAVSEAFIMTNGVKQGCVLQPTLSSLRLSDMLMDAYRDERPGIRIAYRTDDQLHNQR
ncbi:hypothetical protein SprV_0602225700 [Sparganum proliferum]